MATDLRDWNTAGLLDHFIKIHKEMPDRAFAFVLGAGASRPSGIPTGGELVSNWLNELQRQFDPLHETRGLSDWATAENLGIPGFEFARAAEYYPQIFELRFRDDPEEGYAGLEAVMADRDPSLGYSVLARILAETRHRVVITTNFDNLVADSLSIFTKTHPFVCGHESLTGFVTARMRRPLIAKIHRDLFFAPINDTEAVAKLKKGWEPVLRELFRNYSPVVLGYGGNDGSLMNLLDSLNPGEISGRMFWCYRQKGGEPSETIRKLVRKHRGALVPIVGFDEFMLQLGDKLGLGLLDNEIEDRARERAKRYRQAVLEIRSQLGTVVGRAAGPTSEAGDAKKAAADVYVALNATINRKSEQPKDWWGWELKARAEPEPNKREQVYRDALVQFPGSAELTAGLATLLSAWKPNEAEILYRGALELDPHDPRHATNLAVFLDSTGLNAGEADKLFITAIEVDPTNIRTRVLFANFVARVRKMPAAAERQYKKALERDPFDLFANGHYARFLAHVRKDYPEAARHFQRTLGDDGKPKDGYFAAEQAAFLSEALNDNEAAERLFKESLALFPDDPAVLTRYAGFLVGGGRIAPAREAIVQAFHRLIAPSPLLAEALFLRALVLRLEGRDERPMLGRMKTLFARGFGRDWWFCDSLMESAKKRLSPEDAGLYRALVEAILIAEQTADLDHHPHWKEVAPIPLELLVIEGGAPRSALA